MKNRIIIKQALEGIGQFFIMIKRILTLKVTFDNILSIQKYKKVTKIPKASICVLGISKL